jgi:hypothetical protein
MPALADNLGLPEDALVASIGDRMRPPREHEAASTVTDLNLLKRCQSLHEELLDVCVLGQVGAKR